MRFKPGSKLTLVITMIVFSTLAACSGSPDTPENADTENLEWGSAAPAMVDSVAVEQQEGHYYAIVSGNYPDPCTYISSVEQVVDENTIRITLLTGSPADVMCAAVLTPFTVDVLLTIGGLLPQEYTVVVNDGPSTTFFLE
jgi:hypothetical protein